MLVITRPNKVPFGGYWKYQDKETGTAFAHPVIQVLENKVYQHKKANNLPWDPTEFIQNVCASTGAGICHDADGHEYNAMEQMLTFKDSMVDWIKSGFATASQETLAYRAAKCHECNHWRQGRASLMFGKCKICGCRGSKLALATSKCPIGRW